MTTTNVLRYSTSHLSKKEAQRIWKDLFHFLEYKADFSKNILAKSLAVQLKTNPKYLSQVINQAIGLTMTSLINCYRINQLIHKLKQGEASLKTIEALIQESGFRNRTSAYRAFNKFIGCHPTDILRKK